MDATTTHFDHAACQARCRKMTDAELRYVSRDCREAMAALPENPKNSEYADTAAYCGMELAKRNKRNK